MLGENVMGTAKAMRLIDGTTGRMQCKVCGSVHDANLKRGGGYVRGSWQCVNGCDPRKSRTDAAGGSAGATTG